jgi:hypothetical protein
MAAAGRSSSGGVDHRMAGDQPLRRSFTPASEERDMIAKSFLIRYMIYVDFSPTAEEFNQGLNVEL